MSRRMFERMEGPRALTRGGITLVVLVILAPVIWGLTVRVQAWSLRRAGDELYAAGDTMGAVERYERMARLLPRQPSSHAFAADTIRDLLFSEAGRALELDEFRALAARGMRHYLRAIETGPPNAWAYSGIAEVVRALGRQKVRREALDLEQLVADPLASLRPLDRLEEALWVKTVQIEPRNYYYRDIIGDYYWRHGFSERALSHFRAAVALQPILDRHFYVGQWALSEPEILQVVEEGIEQALDAPGTEVARGEIHHALGRLYLDLGRGVEARERFEAAAATAQADWLPMLDIQIGRLLAKQGDAEGALAAYRRATERAPELVSAWTQLGQGLSAMGRHEEAISALKHARGLEPGEFQPAWLLARELERGGKDAEAVKLLEHLLRFHADRQQLYARLIEHYQRIGRPNEAVRVARELARRYPDEPVFQEQVEQLQEKADAR